MRKNALHHQGSAQFILGFKEEILILVKNKIAVSNPQSPPRFLGQKNQNFGNSISENDHFNKFSVVSFDFSLVSDTVFFSGFFIGELAFFYWRTRIFLLENSRIFSASVRQATEKQASPGKKSLGI